MARKKYNEENPKPKTKRTHTKAVRLLAKRAATKSSLSSNCIPKAVELTEGGLQTDYTQRKLPHDMFKEARLAYLKLKYRTTNKRAKRKAPYWFLTSGRCYNIEERQLKWGAETREWRVDSEIKKFNSSYVIPKFTREQYIIGACKHACKKWEKTHPMPQKEIDGTRNAFYETEKAEWTRARADIHNKKLFSFKNRPAKLIPILEKQGYFQNAA